MSNNRQADTLRLDVLGSDLVGRTWLALKSTHIAPKKLKKLEEGSLIDGFDPLHLRLIRDGQVIARAKLGQVNGREAVHIVSTISEPLHDSVPGKHRLLEARLRLLSETREYAEGDVLEFDLPLSREIILLADGRPIAIAEMVAYDEEPVLRITRMIHG